MEWYENSLRFPDSSVSAHHRAVWGDRPYRSFAADFERGTELWDPAAWASAFATTGARYVVLVAKHMDGWCLWPTSVNNPMVPGWFSKRDIVGELADAVRGEGLRFGLYYCGGLDSTFCERPLGTMGDVIAAIPRSDYPAYAEAQLRELIDRYRPSVLWNDVAWPGRARALWPLLADYYAAVPDGIVNDRWLPWSPAMKIAAAAPGRRLVNAAVRRQTKSDGGLIPPRPPHFGYRTPEYTTFEEIQTVPWECVRGMDRSFGYNAESSEPDFLSRQELLWTLTDIASKGGNLLLNVGPRGVDAQIPPRQLERLDWLGGFVGRNAAALIGTRPWVAPGTHTAEGDPVRYTARGTQVFAYVRPSSGQATFREIAATTATTVTTVGEATISGTTISGQPLGWRESDDGISVDLPPPGDDNLIVIAFEHVVPRDGVRSDR